MELSGSPVYGSTKKDLFVFVFPVIFSIGVALTVHYAYPGVHPFWYYPLMMVLFDTPHFFSGYWVMFTTPNQSKKIKRNLFGLFVLWLSFYVILTHTNQWVWVYAVHAHLAAWHFLRQQGTWFHLSMSGTKPTKLGEKINQLGLYASTWGVFFVSLCDEEAFGWYTNNDMIVFPSFMRPFAEMSIYLAIGTYMIYHAWRVYKTKKFPLVGNVVWLTGLLIFGCRMYGPNIFIGPLIIIPHAMTYLYLLHRYAKAHGKKRWGINPVVGVWVGYAIGFTFQLYYNLPLMVTGNPMARSAFEVSLLLAIGTAHFFHDKIFWNGKDNPGWHTNVLGPTKEESDVMKLRAS